MRSKSKAEEFIDLKPDSSLLDANFDSYKLSLDPFPSYSHPIQPSVRELQTSNTQYGLEHIKLFSDVNYLTYDRYSSDSAHKSFVCILQDLHVCSIIFDVQSKKFSVYKNHALVSVPTDYETRDDRYPATISFPDAHYVFVSNGFGRLTMYSTGDRRTQTPWQECLSVEPLTVHADLNAFLISESRCIENRYDVLLRSVVPGKKALNEGNFSNKAVWLSVTNENGKMTMGEVRGITCSGHIEMMTFDNLPDSLIVVGTGDLSVCGNKVDLSDDTDQEMKGDDDAEIKNPIKKKYAWSQTATDVTAVFTCTEQILKKDISLSLSATSIHLSLRNTILIGGMLGGSIDPTSSTYTIDGDKLELFLSKSGIGVSSWTELVLGDKHGTYEVDPESLSTASELLERFTCESQASGDSGIGKSFNTEQLEDCDSSTDDICRIRWLNCTSEKVIQESDITGHTVLFSVCLDDGPRFLCLRMDVDGILWKFTDDSKKVKHHATFSAFGYVQASKTQRRFSTCPADCSYAVIVEAKRHAFVYWQPTVINTDLRNRRTGHRVAGVAKQQLISLSKCFDFEQPIAVTENIVGVHADSQFLFILTTTDIFAIHLKNDS